MRQIVLDTETTGLNPAEGHRIIEVAGLELINRRVTGEHIHFYINPEREVEAEALQVHNITNEFLADKPLFQDIQHPLFDFIAGAELIIHNAPFDLSFLDSEYLRHRPDFKTSDHCAVIDTLVMARKMHPGQRNTLDALCKRYGVDRSHRQWHGALLDAELLARVYLAMTGGQISLFAEAEVAEKKIKQNKKAMAANKPRNNLRVIAASNEELNQHQELLKQLTKQAGKHFWKENEA